MATVMPWCKLEVLVGLSISVWLLYHDQFNPLVSVLVFAIFLCILRLNRQTAICTLLAFLFFLGDIRRVSDVLVGFPSLDMLLIVGPGLTLILVAPLLAQLELTGRLAKLMFAFVAVMIVEIFNPLQGGLAVGLTGVMFVLIPVLWFFVGKKYGDIDLTEIVIYRVVIPTGIVAATLGLCQNFIGFLPWEQAWIDVVRSHYSALNVGGGFIRAFGFSVNGIEYCNLLLVSAVLCTAAAIAGRRSYLSALPLLLPALFMASSRGSIVRLIVATSATWAVSRKASSALIRFPVALALLVSGGLALLNSGLLTPERPKSAAAMSIQHQINGLQHPTDEKYSTAMLHSTMFLGGLWEGIKAPLGHGLGAATLGGGKFADESIGSTEIDISDIFVSLGLIGGALYLWLILDIFRIALIGTSKGSEQKWIFLPIFGLLVAMLGSWIALGQYAISPLVWFLIGVLAKQSQQSKARVPAQEISGTFSHSRGLTKVYR